MSEECIHDLTVKSLSNCRKVLGSTVNCQLANRQLNECNFKLSVGMSGRTVPIETDAGLKQVAISVTGSLTGTRTGSVGSSRGGPSGIMGAVKCLLLNMNC